MPEPRTVSELNIPADMLLLAPALSFVEELARGLGFESAESLNIRLALEETLANVIRHGYPDDPNGRIGLRCEVLPTGLRLAVREKGLPYDPGTIAAYDPAQASLDGGAEGLGTFLVRHAVDEVEHHNLGREGREIVLTRHLRDRHVARLLGLAEPKAAEPEAPTEAVEFEVRPFQAGDALEVSRCAYLTYGYSYEDYIYYPERVAAMNAEGALHSVVAVARDGRFMGHAAAKRLGPGVPLLEFGLLLVSPQFRGHGVAGRLMDFLKERVSRAGASCAFGRAVAGHTVSQRMSEDKGMRVSGLLLGTFPKNVEFKKLTGVIPDKMSCLLLWFGFHQRGPRRLYPPARHRDWIARLYANLGLAWDESSPPAALPEQSQLESHFTDILNIGEITVPDCGPGALDEALRTMRRLCLRGADAVYLFLNLEHPGCPDLAQALEGHGCFFAGVLPERVGGRDALVLQRLNNLVIRYENIRLDAGQARALLD
jgi:serine/threonine-protein kinase RsbW